MTPVLKRAIAAVQKADRQALLLGAVGLTPELRRDLEQSNERAEAMNEVWRRLSARG
jgi:hypothetical protein